MAEGYGACLMNKPQVVKDMVRHVRNQVDKPNYAVSIKIRCLFITHSSYPYNQTTSRLHAQLSGLILELTRT